MIVQDKTKDDTFTFMLSEAIERRFVFIAMSQRKSVTKNDVRVKVIIAAGKINIEADVNVEKTTPAKPSAANSWKRKSDKDSFIDGIMKVLMKEIPNITRQVEEKLR